MVSFSRPVKTRFLTTATFVITLVGSAHVLASDDAYLKMLEGEAEDVVLDQSGQIKNDVPLKEALIETLKYLADKDNRLA